MKYRSKGKYTIEDEVTLLPGYNIIDTSPQKHYFHFFDWSWLTSQIPLFVILVILAGFIIWLKTLVGTITL